MSLKLLEIYLESMRVPLNKLKSENRIYDVLSFRNMLSNNNLQIIAELKITRVSERSGRVMDHEQEDVFEKLRSKGYM